MKIDSSVYLINQYANDNNFLRARAMIEKDWNRLTEYKNFQLLNQNAKQLFKIIQQEKESGISEELTQSEKNILNVVNKSIHDLRLPYAKRIFLEHTSLFEKPAAMKWLSSDARFVCDSWRKSQEE